MEIQLLKKLGIAQTKLDALCKKYNVVPIQNFSNNFIDNMGYVYKVIALQQGDYAMEKVESKYSKRNKVNMYYLKNDITGEWESHSNYYLYVTTYYGCMNPDCDIWPDSQERYSTTDMSEVRWRIDDYKTLSTNKVLINGIEFRRIYIRGTPFPYFINSVGTVYDELKNKFVKRVFQHNYYVRITLTEINKDGNTAYPRFSIHRLVYIMWSHDNEWISEELQINHIDGFKNHNWPENLELCTGLKNLRHAKENNLRYAAFTEPEIHKICGYLQDNIYTPTEISEKMNREYRSIRWVIKAIMKKKAYRDISAYYDLSGYASTYHGSDVKNEEIHNICNLYVNEHKSRKEICEITGRCPTLVNQILRGVAYTDIGKQYGLPIDKIRSVMNADQVIEICEYIMAQKPGTITRYDVAEHFNRSYRVITSIINHRTMPEITSKYDFSKVFPRQTEIDEFS